MKDELRGAPPTHVYPPDDKLEAAFIKAGESMNLLATALDYYYNLAPHLFKKPVAEMGASDKMRTAMSILVLLGRLPGKEKG